MTSVHPGQSLRGIMSVGRAMARSIKCLAALTFREQNTTVISHEGAIHFDYSLKIAKDIACVKYLSRSCLLYCFGVVWNNIMVGKNAVSSVTTKLSILPFCNVTIIFSMSLSLPHIKVFSNSSG